MWTSIDGIAISKNGFPTSNNLTQDFEYDLKKPSVLNVNSVYAKFDVHDCSDQLELTGLS